MNEIYIFYNIHKNRKNLYYIKLNYYHFKIKNINQKIS